MIVGIGCDIVEIERIVKKKDRHSSRILTDAERAIFDSYSGKRQNEFLAGRFAAKEAIFKAIPNCGLTISQIEVIQDQSGQPRCCIPGYEIMISIAHENAYAIAYAVVNKYE